ncbi:hypothetical protein QBC35DRAFT_458240 [Podospora australis]|uniref:Rhodopsin domain-containing protein n=1 Tax=Podospora australis TaxID=1536484 RepID=A0AAN6X6S2_9PEZI|nr:hypothetical protein QBC35DRAFT_458240 [Podospora australis]
MADAGGGAPSVPTGLVAPEPDISIAGRFLGASISLYLVALILVLWRLYLRRRDLNETELALTLASVPATGQLGLLWAAIPYGLGRHNFYLSIDDQVKGGQLVQTSYFLSVWGVAFGRISNTLLLKRLSGKLSRADLGAYWCIIFIQVLCASSANITQGTQCRPVAANWNPTISGTCPDQRTFQVALRTVGVITTATDLFLITMSIKVIHTLSMPLRQRISLISLLGFGVFFVPAQEDRRLTV